MIGVKNQYLLKFAINKYEDFIDIDDLYNLKIDFSINQPLPTISISFRFEEDDLLKYINEGNALKISIGRDTNSLKDMKFILSKIDIKNEGDRFYRIDAFGYLDNLNFLHESKIGNYKDVSSAISGCCGSYFNIKSEVSGSGEFFQYNINGYMFMLYLQKYSSSAFLWGVDVWNNLIAKDVDKLNTKSKFIIKQLPNPNKFEEIGFIEAPTVSENIGHNNIEIIYPKSLIINNNIQQSNKPNVVLAQSKAVINNKVKPMVVKNIITKYDTEVSNALKTLPQTTMISNTDVYVSFIDNFKPITLLDTILLHHYHKKKTMDDYFISGKYFVKGITYVVDKKRFTTNITLSRESINNNFGDEL